MYFITPQKYSMSYGLCKCRAMTYRCTSLPSIIFPIPRPKSAWPGKEMLAPQKFYFHHLQLSIRSYPSLGNFCWRYLSLQHSSCIPGIRSCLVFRERGFLLNFSIFLKNNDFAVRARVPLALSEWQEKALLGPVKDAHRF